MEAGELVPDFGPRRAHPTAGRGAGRGAARRWWPSTSTSPATTWSSPGESPPGLRESGGGLPGVRALGLYLDDRGRAQVSTNVHDHRAVPLREIVERGARAAPSGRGGADRPGARGRRSRAFPRTCRCAASTPSGTSHRGGAARPSVTSTAHGPDEAQAHPQAPRNPRRDDRALRPHRAPPEAQGRQADRAPAARGAAVQPPTWRGAINRAAIAAAVFGVLLVLAASAGPSRRRSRSRRSCSCSTSRSATAPTR